MQQAVGVQARTPVQTSSFEMLRLVETEGLAGTWVLDVRSSELRWSAGLCGLLGLGRQTEPSVAAFLDLIHPQDRSGFGNAAWALASGNRPPPVFRLLRPDGLTTYRLGGSA